MKQTSLIMVTFIALAALACGLSAPVSTPQPGLATIVAATLQSLPTQPAPSPLPPTMIVPTAAPAGIPITYQNVSVVIPAGLDAYFKGMTGLLDSASPDSFQPVLPMLDALVQSITVNPK